jgi:predicted phage tail protein
MREGQQRRNDTTNIKIDHGEMDCEDAGWIKQVLGMLSVGCSFITDFGLDFLLAGGSDNRYIVCMYVYIYILII